MLSLSHSPTLSNTLGVASLCVDRSSASRRRFAASPVKDRRGGMARQMGKCFNGLYLPGPGHQWNPPTPADARGSAPGNKTSKFSRTSSKSSSSGSSSGSSESSTSSKSSSSSQYYYHYYYYNYYYYYCYYYYFPFGSCLLNRSSSSSSSCLLNRRSSSSNSSSSWDWMVFSYLATVVWSACLSKNIVFLGFQTTR